MRTRTVASALVAAIAALALAVAFAGEVQGPPGTPGVPFSGSGTRTAAPTHANSICAYNGLNDMNPDQGQIGIIVQTPHNQGSPGDAGQACRGGSNPENPPSP
jgi:hypothetical protein